MPQLWIVGGPNGAGKTTIADRWIAPLMPVVSPDSIAVQQNLSPVQAGRAAVLEQERLLRIRADFCLDTTFSGNRELALMRRAADADYEVNLIFVCVTSPYICLARITERVAAGGHAVPPEDVFRRYPRSIQNLQIALGLADNVMVFDNTAFQRRLVLTAQKGALRYQSTPLPSWLPNQGHEEFGRSAHARDSSASGRKNCDTRSCR